MTRSGTRGSPSSRITVFRTASWTRSRGANAKPETLGRVLFGAQQRRQPGVVAGERRGVVAVRLGQLGGQHVGLDHRQRGTLPGQQRRAGRRVTDQGHPAPAPGRHADLAHAVEVERAGLRHRVEDRRCLPAGACEPAPQQCLLLAGTVQRHVAAVAEGDEEHRDVLAQRQPQHLEPDVGVHHGDELVARAVPGDVEGGHDDAEVVLEPLLRTEGQQAHPRVQAVGSHHEVEVPPRPAAERHVHAVAVVVDAPPPCRRRRSRRARPSAP